MIPVVSVDNMRLSDKSTIENKTPSKELMYRAGRAIYESVDWHGKILVVAGTGNNAGDGYVVASLLKSNGYDVEILLSEKSFSEDGKYYFDICQREKIPTRVYNCDTFDGYDIILDCIFGTGFKGSIKGSAREIIEKINLSQAYVISADMNSGLNGDSGLGDICVQSDLTISIGTYKSGHFLGMAKDKMKKIINCDIGIEIVKKPFILFEKSDAKALLEERKNYSNKGTYGYVTLIGGSFEYSGAIKLANISACAMRSGCGVVKIAAPKSICQSIMPHILESTLYPLSEKDGAIIFDEKQIQGAINNVKCVCVGMGLGQRGDNEMLIEYLLKNCVSPLIIDADGINTLAKMDKALLKNAQARVVLTPHLKELERLTGVSMEEINKDPIRYAYDFAKEYGVILLLKGPTTIITDGEDVYLVNTGCPGMATAGSGDVLCGILASICAWHKDTKEATALGAFINGYSGQVAKRQYGDISMIASDTAKSISIAINEICK